MVLVNSSFHRRKYFSEKYLQVWERAVTNIRQACLGQKKRLKNIVLRAAKLLTCPGRQHVSGRTKSITVWNKERENVLEHRHRILKMSYDLKLHQPPIRNTAK
jgi:hypothetical protein